MKGWTTSSLNWMMICRAIVIQSIHVKVGRICISWYSFSLILGGKNAINAAKHNRMPISLRETQNPVKSCHLVWNTICSILANAEPKDVARKKIQQKATKWKVIAVLAIRAQWLLFSFGKSCFHALWKASAKPCARPQKTNRQSAPCQNPPTNMVISKNK